MLAILLQQPLEDYDLSALRRLASGGAPLPPEVGAEFQRAASRASRWPRATAAPRPAAIISTTPIGQVRPGTVGKPAPGVTVRIERPDGSEAGPARTARSASAAPMVMTGYWHAEPETDAHAARRLAPHRRRGPAGRGRLPVHRGPDQGPDHPRRLQRLPARRRGRAGRAPGRGGGGGGRPAGRRRTARRSVAFVQLRAGAAVTAADLIELRQGAPVGGEVPARGPDHRRRSR